MRPLPGYKCAILDITEAQAHDPVFTVPILTRPDARTPVQNNAADLVVVHDPKIRVDGYVQVLAFSGTPGWIASAADHSYPF